MRKTIVTVIIFMLFSACKTETKKNEAPKPEYFNIKYEVTGTVDEVFITYEDESGNTVQKRNQEVPWAYEMRIKKGDYASVMAQGEIGEDGEVIAKVYKNGQIFKQESKSGLSVIVHPHGYVR